MLKTVTSVTRTSLKTTRRAFKILNPDDYIYNQREANLTRKVREAQLTPLPNASILKRSRPRYNR